MQSSEMPELRRDQHFDKTQLTALSSWNKRAVSEQAKQLDRHAVVRNAVSSVAAVAIEEKKPVEGQEKPKTEGKTDAGAAAPPLPPPLAKEDSLTFSSNKVRDSGVVPLMLGVGIRDDSMVGTRSKDAQEMRESESAATGSGRRLGIFGGLRQALIPKQRGGTPSSGGTPATPPSSRRLKPGLPSDAGRMTPGEVRRGRIVTTFFDDAPVQRPPAPPVAEGRGEADWIVSQIRGMGQTTWDAPETVDYWSSRPLPQEQWTVSTDMDAQSLVDVACRSAGFHIEIDWKSETHNVPAPPEGTPLGILNGEESHAFYHEFIATTPHENLISPEGPVVVSVQLHPPKGSPAVGTCKALVRTKKEDRRVLLPFDKRMKVLKSLVPSIRDMKLTLVKNPQFPEELVGYETAMLPPTKYKFGVLYAKANQKNEDEIYSNVADESNRPYNDFLAFLGKTIKLEGWTGYRAGLDVTANNTGTHSVHITFREKYEIMYHVATMLPFQAHDPQRVERKRHIGNDVIVIVFKEQADESDKFVATCLTSHFNHCIFVFRAELGPGGETTHYTLTIANKSGVPPYPPFIPETGARFENGPQFREWLLTKLINAERTALGSPEFQSLVTARKQRLVYLCQKASLE
jgi:hypothetical protein